MQKKQTTYTLIDGQIQSIRNAIKVMRKMHRAGYELTNKQRKALSCIVAYDLDDIVLGQ